MDFKASEICKLLDTNPNELTNIDSNVDSNSVYNTDLSCQKVSFDSRSILDPHHTLFVAFVGQKTDGHQFLEKAHAKGVRNFLIQKEINPSTLPNSNVFLVPNTLWALQRLARKHREKIDAKIIGITGSNGKTIVKEWLYQALSKAHIVYRSPGSYNSQLGVALSILEIQKHHEWAIIEAGISKTNEMIQLEKMIQPHIGILTNIGDAHNSGFVDLDEKLQEKILLFTNSEVLITSDKLYDKVQNLKLEKVIWGKTQQSKYEVIAIEKSKLKSDLQLNIDDSIRSFTIPFSDDASIENALHVFATLTHLDCPQLLIEESLQALSSLTMRLQIKEGINNCILLDDSYSFDLSSLQVAFSKLSSLSSKNKKTLIISDFDQAHFGHPSYVRLSEIVNSQRLEKLILIGEKLSNYKNLFTNVNSIFLYSDATRFKEHFDVSLLNEESILIKGARKFQLDSIVYFLSEKINGTILEIKLNNLAENIEYFSSKIHETELMAVVKASAYGSGSEIMSSFFNHSSIDRFAVAVPEEAIALREQGIHKPILVLNPSIHNFSIYHTYDLALELSNALTLNSLSNYQKLHQKKIKVHLKLDTGMHRLGFMENELDNLIDLLSSNQVNVEGIFTHLSASDDPNEEKACLSQLDLFDTMFEKLVQGLGYRPIKHALNSHGVLRFPNHQYDLVRIGIGLYGLSELNANLAPVHTLKTNIIQIKKIVAGQSVGYGNHTIVDRITKIAIIGIGYADGLMRKAGNGRYSMSINGQKAPILGNVCMDLCILDITGVDEVYEGDEVVIFNGELPVEQLALACDTISYEILSRLSPRIKRVYVYQ